MVAKGLASVAVTAVIAIGEQLVADNAVNPQDCFSWLALTYFFAAQESTVITEEEEH